MRIYLNDESLDVQEGATIAGLVGTMALEEVAGVAVALNDEVVRRGDWDKQRLAPEDRVLLIAPIQGG